MTSTARVDRPFDGNVVGETAPILEPRDGVRWGPIWAGLLTALGLFLLLSLAGVAIGATTVDSGATDPDTAGQVGGIVTAILALIAFFVGGFVTGRTAAVRGRGYSLLNGFLVWALGVVIILALAAFGLGSLFGAAGDLFSQYQQLGSPTPQGVDANEVTEGIRNSSLGAFIGMLLPAAAASLGGYLGGRNSVEVVTR